MVNLLALMTEAYTTHMSVPGAVQEPRGPRQ